MIYIGLDEQRNILEVSELPIKAGAEVTEVIILEGDTLTGFEDRIAVATAAAPPYYHLRLDDRNEPVAVERQPTAEEQAEVDRSAARNRLRGDLTDPVARTLEEKVSDLIVVLAN